MKNSRNDTGTSGDISQRLRILFFIRVIFVTFLLGAVIFLNAKTRGLLSIPLIAIYGLIIFAYLFNILSGVVLRFFGNYIWFLYLEVCIDTLFVTSIVYITGGSNSVLAFLYIFVILEGGYLAFRRGAVLSAALSAVLYGILLDLEFYRVLPYFQFTGDDMPVKSSAQVISQIVYNLIGFLAAGVLWGIVVEQMRRTSTTLEEKRLSLRRLEELTRMVFQNVPSGILTVNKQNMITSINSSAERITGYKLSEVLGRDLGSIFHSFQIDEVRSTRNEADFTKRDGSRLCLGYSVGDLGEEGKVVIFQDLTRQKKLEENVKRSERLAALGQMSAGLAHEIRNLLGAITGSAQLIKSVREGSDERERLTSIMLNESKRLNDLVSNFLNFARPERGMNEVFDLCQIVREVVESFRKSRGNGIEILTELNRKDMRIKGSREGIRQVLYNLLLNAVDAVSDKGEVRVRVINSDRDGFLEMVVSDNGCGIPEDILPKIFDPFFSTKEKGAGMGLATVFRIVEAHAGTINVTSRKGVGTEFRILLPIIEEE